MTIITDMLMWRGNSHSPHPEIKDYRLPKTAKRGRISFSKT